MTPITYCFLVAVLWGAWQLFARATGLPPLAMALIASSVGLIPITLANLYVRTDLFAIDVKQLIFAVSAGLTLGSGMAIYSFLITNREWDLSIYVPISTVMIAIVVVVGSILFFGESLDIRKSIGIASALIAIWLLS